jgi:hypothetical protein
VRCALARDTRVFAFFAALAEFTMATRASGIDFFAPLKVLGMCPRRDRQQQTHQQLFHHSTETFSCQNRAGDFAPPPVFATESRLSFWHHIRSLALCFG